MLSRLSLGQARFVPGRNALQVASLSGPVLRDTARLSQRYPPIARYGVFGVSTWPIGCDNPSPFSDCFPLEDDAKWRCDTPPPPHRRGVSAILARYPLQTRQMRAIPPSATLSRKGIGRYGGVSRTGPLDGLGKVLICFLFVGVFCSLHTWITNWLDHALKDITFVIEFICLPGSGGCTVPTKRVFKENALFIFFILMGSFARTLFSRTLLP